MSKFAQRIVFAAALIFLGEKIVTMFEKILQGIIQRHLKYLIELRKKSEEETSSSFELWWENGPKQQAKETLFKQFAPAGVSPEAFEQLYGSSSTNLLLEPVYNNAKRLAAYAYRQHEERMFLGKISRFRGEQEESQREINDYERRLDLLRSEVLSGGLDPRALEEYFERPAQ